MSSFQHPSIESIPPYAKHKFTPSDIPRMFDDIQSWVEAYKLQFHTMNHKNSFLSFVFTSNKLEGTCPLSISESETFDLLSNVDLAQPPPEDTFQADGVLNSLEEARVQLVRHFLALNHLFSLPKLDIQRLLAVHKLLMSGAIEKDGTRVPAGELRTVDVFAGEHQFPRVHFSGHSSISSIEESAQTICESFETKLLEGQHAYLALSTDLFYEMIQLHPFTNGNGRVCRMLLSYALMRCRIAPFPIQLSSGHPKSRHHYLTAILNRQNLNKPDFLYFLVLKSIYDKTMI